MKLIIRQYLAGLKERNELDAILPDLLSQMGLTVYSRPARGTRQDGVDVAAVGSIDGGPEKVYLFSIKAGDLTRKEWDGDAIQSLRPSLNEVLDAYIRNRIPPEHKGKEVVICMTFGGDVQEQVRPQLIAFTGKNSKEGEISFEEWNGDKLATLIQTHFLREDLLAEGVRSDLRKALALLDEPDSSFEYFKALVRTLDGDFASDEARVRALRQLSVCLWILFSWARDAGNLECCYRASEATLLHGWNIYRAFAGKKNKASRAAGYAFSSIFQAYQQITSAYIAKMVPHVQQLHALSAAVQGGSPIDANLRMFDLLGRLALAGLWSYSALLQVDPEGAASETLRAEAAGAAAAVKFLVSNNPTLYTPAKDDQSTEIALAAILLMVSDDGRETLQAWLTEMMHRIRLAFVTNERYPSILESYSELLDHPVSKDAEYRETVTSASVLYPVLAHIAAVLGDDALFQRVSKLQQEFLSHSNFQLWFIDDVSEDLLYTNKDIHGISFTDIKLDKGPAGFLDMIAGECGQFPQYAGLSCVQNAWWPLALVACRHFRLPAPPQLLQAYVNPMAPGMIEGTADDATSIGEEGVESAAV